MVFSSMIFLSVFMPAVVGLHTLLRSTRARNILLLIASLIFYAYGEPVYVFLMIGTALLCYVCAIFCEKDGNKKTGGRGKRWLVLASVFCLGALAVLKYLSPLTGWFFSLSGKTNPLGTLTMPIGVSFFTFQEISYVADVWRGRTRAQKSFLNVLLYICLFPQLIAGPIVLYGTIEKELTDRKVTAQEMAHGLVRFSYGLSKKVLLANKLAVVSDACYGATPSTATAWLGAAAYMLQIFFDFSGYSDMAIGLGEMMGFHFNENFRWPYWAASLTDFWRRWHISLSSWFRDYLYIPLGGNRSGKKRTALNKMIVFALTGLWHGANITFLVWGLFNGLIVIAEGALGIGKRKQDATAADAGTVRTEKENSEKNRWSGMPGKKIGKRIFRVIAGHVWTVFLCLIGFVLFRADSIADAILRIRAMFSPAMAASAGVSLAFSVLSPSVVIAMAVSIVLCYPFSYARSFRAKGKVTAVEAAVASVLLVLCVARTASGSYNPFIYFRF